MTYFYNLKTISLYDPWKRSKNMILHSERSRFRIKCLQPKVAELLCETVISGEFLAVFKVYLRFNYLSSIVFIQIIFVPVYLHMPEH